MQTSPTPVWARDHTLFGVCEALGEDFGFNPIFLRVPLAVCLLLNPLAVFATYAGLGLLVALSRFAAPNPSPARTEQPLAGQEPLRAGDNDESDMAIAA
jgi:phage shock protein C